MMMRSLRVGCDAGRKESFIHEREKVRSGPVITKKKTAYKQPTARTRIHYCIICGRASFRPFVRSVRQHPHVHTTRARHTHTHH